jgi:hypothetical protein
LQNLHRTLLGLSVALTLLSGRTFALGAPQATLAPREIMRRTVENELRAGDGHERFMFRSRKRTASGSQTKIFVQTQEATAGMLVAINDQPLTPEQRQGEEGRLRNLIRNPSELKRKQKQERDDADRIRRIMRALPDAFEYEADGVETGTPGVGKEGDELIRLKFTPNSNYKPPSRVEQVLQGMQGVVLVDARQHRIARIDGTLFRDVSFGWGILGHLDKGGHFQVDQANVVDGAWEITHMRLNFTGKVLLLKTIVLKAEEEFSNFQRVPDTLSFADGVSLLMKQSGVSESRNGHDYSSTVTCSAMHMHSAIATQRPTLAA